MLIVGYGNPGRGDDGLGPEVAEAIDAAALPGVEVKVCFQLAPELALALNQHDLVVFVDAALSGPAPFSWRPIIAGTSGRLDSHGSSPEALVALATMMDGKSPDARLLAVRGYDFDRLHDGLSAAAAANAGAAVAFLLGEIAASQAACA